MGQVSELEQRWASRFASIFSLLPFLLVVIASWYNHTPSYSLLSQLTLLSVIFIASAFVGERVSEVQTHGSLLPLIEGYAVLVGSSVIFFVFGGLAAAEIGFIWIAIGLLGLLRFSLQRGSFQQNPRMPLGEIFASTFALWVFYSLSQKINWPINSGEEVWIHEDLLWTLGNSWEILRSDFEALDDARFVGVNWSYHYAQNIFVAVSSEISGLSPIDLHLEGLTIFWALAQSISLYALFNVYFRISPVLSLLGSLAVLSPINTEYGGYLNFFFGYQMSAHFGIPFFLILFGFLLSDFRKIGIKESFFLFFLAVSVFSSKGVLAPLFIGAFFGYSMLLSVLKRPAKYYFCYGRILLILIFSFVILKLTIFANSDGRIPANFWSLLYFYDFIKSFIRLFIFLTLNPLFLSSIFIILYSWFNKQSDFIRFSLPLITFNLSFIIAASGLASIMPIKGMEFYCREYSNLVTSLVFSTVFCGFCHKVSNHKYLKIGILLWFGAQLIDIHQSYDQLNVSSQFYMEGNKFDYGFISNEQAEGMEWLRSNTKMDSVILSSRHEIRNRHNDQLEGQFFGYSGLSGRQFFAEGDEFNLAEVMKVADDRANVVRRIFSGDWDCGELDAMLDGTSVDYVLVDLRPGSRLGYQFSGCLNSVFANSEIQVFAVAK